LYLGIFEQPADNDFFTNLLKLTASPMPDLGIFGKLQNEKWRFACPWQEGKGEPERFCNLQSNRLHFASEVSHSRLANPA